MNKNKDTIYKTVSFELSAFLCTKKFRLQNIENHSKRKTFVFDNSDQLEKMVRIFYFGEMSDENLKVNVRELFRATRDLKSRLFSNIN